jgi:peroxiredoxin
MGADQERGGMTARGWVAAVVVGLWVVSRALGAWAEAVVGEPAPAFSLTDAHGTARSLAEFKGKFVVLEWFNHDCPFVGKHYNSGNMQALQADATGRGVVWLTMASSAPGKQGYLTREQALAIIAARGAHQTALLLDSDGAVGRLYGAKTTPHLFVLDPEGRIIYAGAIDDRPSTDPADIPGATNYVRRALDEALAGQPVSVPSTKSYGCSVKY